MPAPTADLTALGEQLQWSDRACGIRTAAAMPASLGRLVEFADWLSSVQAAVPPRDPGRVRLLQFGRGGADTVGTLAADLDVGVQVVEAPAGTDTSEAIAAGIALADREVDGGADLLIVALPDGPSDDAGLAAVVAVAVLTDSEPARVLARGAAAADPQSWMRRAEHVRDRRRRAVELRERPEDLLAELGDPALAAAAGFVLQAAVRRTPVLLDGTGAAAAALVAHQAQPRVVRWLAAAGATPDPAHTLAATAMGLRCVLDAGIDTGDGTAGLVAVPLLRAAARLAAETTPSEETTSSEETTPSDEQGPATPSEEDSDDAV